MEGQTVTAMPETAAPQAGMPETALPETALPETALSEGALSEGAVPEEAGVEDPKIGLADEVVAAIKTCYDPEIPVDIWELGLIYRVDVNDAGTAEIDMTLTSPMCPVAGILPGQVRQAVEAVPGIAACKVELVWDPPWRHDMMSEVARVQLDMF
jgi:FeS assembly SUF system protein